MNVTKLTKVFTILQLERLLLPVLAQLLPFRSFFSFLSWPPVASQGDPHSPVDARL